MFRRQPKVFSFETCVLICLSVLVLLSIISVFYNWQKNSVQHHTLALQEKHSELVAQLERLTQQLGSWQKQDSPQSQSQALQSELSAHRFLLQQLGSRLNREQKGFSPYFEGFARQVVQGLWLTRFEVSNGGERVSVSGSTIESQLVADFIRQLSSEPVLQGVKLRLLKLVREHQRDNWLDFTLASNMDKG